MATSSVLQNGAPSAAIAASAAPLAQSTAAATNGHSGEEEQYIYTNAARVTGYEPVISPSQPHQIRDTGNAGMKIHAVVKSLAGLPNDRPSVVDARPNTDQHEKD